MPEYLAPDVFVEEINTLPHSVEGVATHTTAMAGITRFGPVPWPGGPLTPPPSMLTSYAEFERRYGGDEPLLIGSGRCAYLAHSVRAFFNNGGRQLYVSRVYQPRNGDPAFGVASKVVSNGINSATWRARWPGAFGNVRVDVQPVRTRMTATRMRTTLRIQDITDGAVIEVLPANSPAPATNAPLRIENLAVVRVGPRGAQRFSGHAPRSVDQVINRIELAVSVSIDARRVDRYDALGTDAKHARYIGRILDANAPEHPDTVIALDWLPPPRDNLAAARLVVLLSNPTASGDLSGGNDGGLPEPAAFEGVDGAAATGLHAFDQIDDIAIVTAPDIAALDARDSCIAATRALITHVERLRYRFAIIDAPRGCTIDEARTFRALFTSKNAALYYPWVRTADPGAARGATLALPAAGLIAGIYARVDVERGVHKAPANELINGITGFETSLSSEQSTLLNTANINVLRDITGRGLRVWGARTLSTDPEWMYVNLRRLFNFLEHSIDRGTQWAAFEPNNDMLWPRVISTIENFLITIWKSGALSGVRAQEAYFVRCDRSTMSQNDLDTGRLICLVGVAPVKPAEFVIFRIQQMTADAAS